MRPSALATSFLLALLIAFPASANWFVKAKTTCYDSANKNSTKLEKTKGKNLDIVAACLGVSTTDPAVDNYSLTFDSDTQTLHVIRNCDALEVCALSSQPTCASGTKESTNSYKTKRQCIFGLVDFGQNDVDGTMICKQSESYNFESNKFGFSTSCKGQFEFNGLACTLSFSSGKLFNLDNGCPAQ